MSASAHCIAVALVDLETECRGDLCLIGRYIGAFAAQPFQFERRRDMALLRGLAIPASRGPQVARYAITALQQPGELVLQLAIASECRRQRCIGLLLEPTVEGAEEDPSTLDFSLSTLTEIN
jgi:hypothetical protein